VIVESRWPQLLSLAASISRSIPRSIRWSRPQPLMHAPCACCLGSVTDEGLLGGTDF
jgi:hypothetical protein